MKYIFLFLSICALYLLAGCSTLSDVVLVPVGNTGTSGQPKAEAKTLTDLRANLIKEAETYISKPYASPPNVPNSFDCSSFVSYVYSKFGYTLPRSTSSYNSVGTRIDWKNALPGDLLVFSNVKGTNRADHVAMLYQKSKNGELAGSLLIHAASINTGTSMKKGNANTKTGVVVTELGLRGDGKVEQEYFLMRYMYSSCVLKE